MVYDAYQKQNRTERVPTMNEINNMSSSASALSNILPKQQDTIESVKKSESVEKPQESAAKEPANTIDSSPVDTVEISRQGELRARASIADNTVAVKEAPEIEIQNAVAVLTQTEAKAPAETAQETQPAQKAATSETSAPQKAEPAAKPAAKPVMSSSTEESSDTVYSYELYQMTKSELLDLVLDGSITRSEMNDEIARRAGVSE